MTNKGISRQSRQANERVAQGRCARCGIRRKAEKGATSRLCGECAEKARNAWKRRKKTTKPQKPRLTKAVVEKLYMMSHYAASTAEELGDNDTDRKFKNEIWAACSWVERLCGWYEATHREDQANAED